MLLPPFPHPLRLDPHSWRAPSSPAQRGKRPRNIPAATPRLVLTFAKDQSIPGAKRRCGALRDCRSSLAGFSIRRNNGLESFRAADTNIVVLLELGRWRIFVPAVLILKGRHIDAIEIAASGDCRCYGNRVAGLHILWLGVRRHREISDRAGEA